MEIEIESKRNNPLLNRTEIYFTVKHGGEGTPNREIIRSEIAEKLNVNKEKVIVNTVKSSFGSQEISGYAKIYPSLEKSKEIENNYILRRNKLVEEKEKKEKKKTSPAPKSEEKPIEKPLDKTPEEKSSIEEVKEEKQDVKSDSIEDTNKDEKSQSEEKELSKSEKQNEEAKKETSDEKNNQKTESSIKD